MRTIIAGSILVLSLCTGGLEGASADEFARYPAKIVLSPAGEEVSIERMGPDESLDAFINRMKVSAAAAPSFAGRYSVVLYSCGFICVAGAIIDVKTREFHWLPFVTAGECASVPGKILDFRATSRLLIVRGRVGIADPSRKTFRESDCGVFKYVWTGTGFRRISSVFVK